MAPGKHNGLYNWSKDRVLVTLYNFNVILKDHRLTLFDIRAATGISFHYLKNRLPVFCGKVKCHNIGRKYHPQRTLLNRKAIELNSRPIFTYSLSAYGRHQVETMPIERFRAIERLLAPRWEKVR